MKNCETNEIEIGNNITMSDLCDFNLDFMKEELKSQSTMEENDNIESNSNSNNSIIQNMKHFPSVNHSRFNFENDNINNQNKNQNLNIDNKFEQNR